MAKVKKTVTLDPVIVQEVNKLRKEITPSLSFSAFTAGALWDKIKEKEQAAKQQEEKEKRVSPAPEEKKDG